MYVQGFKKSSFFKKLKLNYFSGQNLAKKICTKKREKKKRNYGSNHVKT
jgi:hypothetical protein